MACKINWTPRAWLTYEANVNYLQQAWTEKEVSNFVSVVDKKVASLSRHPLTGKPRNKKYPNVRCTVVHKRILLVHKHKPLKNEIDLLVFWNTYQSPRKLKVR